MISALHSSQARASSLGNALNVIGLLGICASLAIAFYYQLALHELPCPLCLLQRAGMILTGIGLMMNVRFGVKSAHYGVALAGAASTGIIALRQVFLHILPGDTGYGSTFMGVHFYTLAALSALAATVGIAALLLLKSAEPPATPAWKSWGGKLAGILFILLVAANLASTVLECGGGACEDDPTFYQLLGK